MKEDIKTNEDIIFDIPVAAVEATNSVDDGAGALDMAKYRNAAFALFLITSTATATVDAKLQFSDEGLTGSVWTDEDGATGNDTAITQMVVGDAGTVVQLNVQRAQARFYRLLVTVLTDTVTAVTSQIAGPKVRVDAEA